MHVRFGYLFVFQYKAKRLAEKNVSDMICFVLRAICHDGDGSVDNR